MFGLLCTLNLDSITLFNLLQHYFNCSFNHESIVQVAHHFLTHFPNLLYDDTVHWLVVLAKQA